MTIAKNLMNLDHGSFEEAFRKYYASLCDYCYGITGEKNLSEDIVQDVFVYFWKNRSKVKINTSLKSYLYFSVRNGAMNYIKKQALERKHNPLIVEFIEDVQATGNSDEEILQIKKIKEVIEELPSQCRKVFLMSCINGLKYKEIAEELEISVNTVKSHISKAYKLIREEVNTKPEFMLLFLAGRLVSYNE